MITTAQDLAFWHDFLSAYQITKGKLIFLLRQLNQYYGRQVKFMTGFPLDGHVAPCADIHLNTLIFPPVPLFYNRYILAHEYAHLLHAEGSIIPFSEWHNKEFEAAYKKVCINLGLGYIPTMKLAAGIRARFDELGVKVMREENESLAGARE